MEESIKELNAKLDEIEPVVSNLESTFKAGTSGLSDLKEAGPALLKVHQNTPAAQKEAQRATVRADELKNELDKTRSSIASLNGEIKKILESGKASHAENFKSTSEEIKRMHAELAYLEKKLTLAVQESETSAIEGITKLAANFANQAEGYRAYMLAYATRKVKIPDLEKYRSAIAELKDRILTNKPKNDEVTARSKLIVSSERMGEQVQEAVQALMEIKGEEIRQEIEQCAKKIQEIDSEIALNQEQPVEDYSEFEAGIKLIERVEGEYETMNEELEFEISEAHQALSDTILAYLSQSKTLGKPALFKYSNETVDALQKCREKIAEVKLKVKESKARDAAALGQMSRFIQEAVIKSEGKKAESEIIAKVRKAREKLEGRIDKSEEFYDKRITQLELKADTAIEMIKGHQRQILSGILQTLLHNNSITQILLIVNVMRIYLRMPLFLLPEHLPSLAFWPQRVSAKCPLYQKALQTPVPSRTLHMLCQQILASLKVPPVAARLRQA
eukprot:TRINITY_DN72265_c0_g1_i1.p1 TRINITY_DN72265_c0_g1~~TRINITY_DN72265_c0_g1_i1.p1  ORF type:complete len:535 (-),score=44.25 TRINITY_DN72265_c0_g1_i1:1623-3137(-)